MQNSMTILNIDGKKYLDENIKILIRNHENDKVISALGDVKLHETFDSSNITFLHLSIICKNIFMTKFLIQSGVEIDPMDDNGTTPLIMALKSKLYDQAELLITANANLQSIDNTGKSALTMIFQLRHRGKEFEIIKLSLMKLAVIHRNNDELATTLIQAGCSIDKAVYLNNPSLIVKMLEQGFEVNTKHYKNLNNTALHVAAALNYFDVVRVLLQYGADTCVVNRHDHIPLIHCIVHQPIQDSDVIEVLMPRDYDWIRGNCINSNRDRLPLFYIFTKGTKETLSLFQSRYNVNLHARDMYGETPLHYLMSNNNEGILELFSNAKFDINAQDFRIRTTALHVAATSGIPESVRFLLERGAETDSQDLLGQTPLLHIFNSITISEIRMDTSEKMDKFAECVELLMLYGANPEVKFMFLSILDYARYFRTYSLIKSVIARFVILENSGVPLKQCTYDKIESDVQLKSYYELCVHQIENSKTQSVGRVKLFDIFTEIDEKIALYTRRQEVTDVLINMENQLESYYGKLLRKRLNDAAKINNLRQNVTLLLSDIIELNDPDHLIVYKIVCLLSKCDLENAVIAMTVENL